MKVKQTLNTVVTLVWNISIVATVILTSVFCMLKVTNVVDWDWLIVLLPMIIFVSLLTLCFIILLIWAYFVSDDYE